MRHAGIKEKPIESVKAIFRKYACNATENTSNEKPDLSKVLGMLVLKVLFAGC